MNAIIICRGGRTLPSQNTPMPCAGSRWPGPRLPDLAFQELQPISFASARPPGTSAATSRPRSRSWPRSRSSPPIPRRNRLGAHQPSGPRADLRQKPVPGIVHGVGSFSRIGASGKLGMLQDESSSRVWETHIDSRILLLKGNHLHFRLVVWRLYNMHCKAADVTRAHGPQLGKHTVSAKERLHRQATRPDAPAWFAGVSGQRNCLRFTSG